MPLTLRSVTNTGAPLCAPDGTVLAGVTIRFTLIHAASRFRADAWDAVSGERVGCIDVTVQTNDSGIFTAGLWPTSRSNIPVLYLCHVDYEGFRDFEAPLDAGGAALSWVDFMAAGEAITPQGLTALQQHIQDPTAAHAASAVSVAAILGLNATTVQAALEELALASGATPPDASEIAFTATGGLASTNVQDALAELDTEKQPKDATLTAFAALVTAADKLAYATGVDTFALADFTAAARTFVAATTAADQRTALGLGTAAVLASDTDTTLAADSDLRVPTQKAVKTHVAAAVAALVASAPTTLDTLDELAAALGDDPNFATTLTTLIGQKLAKASNLSDLTSADTALTNLGLTANGKSLVTAANYAAMRSLLSLDTLYQALLVSGTNIKTLNGVSLLGAGDITLNATPGGSSGQPQYNAAGSFAGMSGITWDNTNKVWTLAQGSITTSQPQTFSVTFNDGSVAFVGKTNDFTDTASAAASILERWTVGGTAVHSIAKTGALILPQASNTAGTSGAGIYWGTGQAANIPAYFAQNFNHFWRVDGKLLLSVFSSFNLGFESAGLVLQGDSGVYAFSSGNTTNPGGQDVGISRNAAGVLEINSGGKVSLGGSLRDLKLRNVVGQTGYTELVEMTAPGAGAANTVRLYAEDNGSGKTRLMAIFPSGAAQQIAIEP